MTDNTPHTAPDSDSPGASRLRRFGRGALAHWPGLLAAAFAALATAGTIFNNAYYWGATLFDSAIFATTIWRSGWTLREAPAIGGRTFYLRHISPILLIPDLFSYAAPCDFTTYYAIVYGLLYAILVFAAYRVMEPLFPGRLARHAAALAALAFYVSQPVWQGAWEMHIEIAGPAFSILALRAWQLRRYRQALVWFLLNAAVREDMAYQFAVPLILLALYEWYITRRSDPQLARERLRLGLGLFAILIAYSAGALLIYRVAVPLIEGGDYRIYQTLYYDSSDPFKHLTGELIGGRIWYMFTDGRGTILPLLALFVGAEVFRDPSLLIGAVSFLPFLLALVASKDDLGGRWGSYKPYPLVVVMVWPAIVALNRPATARRRYLGLQLVVLAAGLSQSWTYLDQAHNRWWPQRTTWNVAAYREFGENRLLAEDPMGPRTRLSQSIGSLYPYQADWATQFFEIGKRDDWPRIDTLIWFEGERFQEHVDLFLATDDFVIEAVPDTKIRIAHRRRLAKGVGRILPAPEPDPLPSRRGAGEAVADRERDFMGAVSIAEGASLPVLTQPRGALRGGAATLPAPAALAIPAAPAGGLTLVVWNPLPWPRSELVQTTVASDAPNLVARPAAGGAPSPVQTLSTMGAVREIAFLGAHVPACGCAVFVLEPAGDASATPELRPSSLSASAEAFVLDNGLVRARVDRATGELTSLVDLTSGREALAAGARGNVLTARGDDDRPLAGWETAAVTSKDDGPLRSGVRVERRFRGRAVSIEVFLDANSPSLGCRAHVAGVDDGVRLDVSCGLSATTSSLVLGVPFGVLPASAGAGRPDEHGWADVTQGEPEPEVTPVDLTRAFTGRVSAGASEPGGADFDFAGNYSFPREDLPSRISAHGVTIDVKWAGVGGKDFVACKQQKIRVPEGDYDEVLVTGASTLCDSGGMFKLEGPGDSWIFRMLELPDWCLPRSREPAAVECRCRRGPGGDDSHLMSRLWVKRIDLKTRTRLKALVLPPLENMRIVAITLVRRPTAPRFGVSLLTDSSRPFALVGHELRVGLQGSAGDPGARDGAFDFEYALLPHEGDWRAARSFRRGSEATAPLKAAVASPKPGTVATCSFLSVEPSSVEVVGFERGTTADGGPVLRLAERNGLWVQARVRLPRSFRDVSDLPRDAQQESSRARAATLLEDGTLLEVDLAPFESRTLFLRSE